MMGNQRRADEVRARLRGAIEGVLRRMPHLNLTGRALKFVVSDDSNLTNPRRESELLVVSKQEMVLIPMALFRQMSDLELTSIIAHEMIHAYYRHVERGQGRNQRLWQQASDLEANRTLKQAGLPLQRGVAYDESMATLSAEAIYEHLNRNPRLRRRDTRSQPGEQPGELPITAQHAWQDHSDRWAVHPESVIAEMKVCDVAKGSAGLSSTGERGQTSERGAAMRAPGRQHGTSKLEEQLQYQARRHQQKGNPWSSLLQDFMRDRSYRRSGKRYRRRDISKGLYLPSMRGDGLRLVVALDTSGSTLHLLPHFISEVEQVMRACPHFQLTLIQCAAEICAVDTLSHHELERLKHIQLKGGGGTNFQPVFDHLNGGAERLPNLLIYLTDGQGPTVQVPPNFPVIWVLSDDGRRPAPFGVELPLQAH